LSPGLQYFLPIFLFALGSCIGSFLNVVVWRLPRGESLVTPPSHCPKCNKLLKWYDNLPVVGWIMLGGRCRFCREKISARYPIIEAIAGLLFVGYYLLLFVFQIGPCVGVHVNGDHADIMRRSLDIRVDWPMYGLYMFMISGLLAASLIDAELFQIPLSIPWLMVPVAIVVHALFDEPSTPGGLMIGAIPAALALGAAIGTAISCLLLFMGKLPLSFAEGAPLMEHERAELEKQQQEREKNKAKGKRVEVDEEPPPREWTSGEVRREISKEMLFLLPALFLGFVAVFLVWRVPSIGHAWEQIVGYRWVSAALGSVLGGLVGGFVVWLTRILGTLGFGREAMGLGDVHLMVGVGAVIGAGPAVVAFFLAPAFGLAVALYLILTGTRREIPYGPYLSLASAAVVLVYCQIAAFMAPGVEGFMQMLRGTLSGG
jgi:leader peptidase (prepilin peptidase)/N-methyltransferase